MAIRSLNSVGGFSVGEIAANVILANGDITTGTANLTGNINSANAKLGNLAVANFFSGDGGLLTNLAISTSSISNGTSNVSIPAVNGNVNISMGGTANVLVITATGANIAGTANITGNLNTGNANLGNLAKANFLQGDGYLISNLTVGAGSSIVNGTSNVSVAPSANVTVGVAGTANVINVQATGVNVAGFITSTGTATAGNLSTGGTLGVTGNANVGNLGTAGLIVATGNVTGGNLVTGGVLSVTGNANVGNLGTAGLVVATGNVTGGNLVTGGALSVTGNATVGNISATNHTGTTVNVTGQIISTVATSTAPFVVTSTTQVANLNVATAGSASTATTAGTVTTAAQPNITSVGTLTSLIVGNATANTTFGNGIFTATGNANVGNLGTAGLVVATGNVTGGNLTTGGLVVATGNVTGGNITTGGLVVATGNVTGGNLTTGGLVVATGNVTGGNLVTAGVLSVTGNANVGNLGATAGVFTGTVSVTGNANVGNLGTAGLVVATGNVTGGNLTTGGVLSVTGNANVGNLGTAGLVVATGNITGGNLVTGGVLSVTGNANVGNLGTAGIVVATGNITSSANIVTDSIIGKTGAVTITATGTNTNINLVPNGTGNVDVGGKKISSLGTPFADTDAATKAYVDSVAQGLHIHAPASAATPANLAVLSGGTVTYNNGVSGVGANLTLSVALNIIDGYSLLDTNRVIVKNEANTAHNGIYTWATGGTVLTRASDFDTTTEIAGGDFIFVSNGSLYNDTGWVETEATTSIGTSPIIFAQFSGAGTYTAGTGLTLNGTVFSITDTAVTPAAYGNASYIPSFTVNQQGQLTAAAGNLVVANAATLSNNTLNSTVVNSSLTSVGSLTILTVTGNANVGNLGTAGLVVATGNVTGGNITTGGLVVATGNVTGGNLVTSNYVFAPAIVSNASTYDTRVSLNSAAGLVEITSNGNSAQFGPSGTITLQGASQIVGGTFGGSGITLGGSQTDIYQNRGGNVTIQTGTGGSISNTWIFGTNGSFTAPGNITTTANANVGNLNTGGVVSATGNVAGGNLTTTGVVAATGNINGGNLVTTGNISANNATVGNIVDLGSTQLQWATVTTNATTANQTIVTTKITTTSFTAIEYLIKSTDSAGVKYSMTTVHAITNNAAVDYSVFGGLNLGGTTGTVAVNIGVIGSNAWVSLQVTPSSSNSTVWTTQYRVI